MSDQYSGPPTGGGRYESHPAGPGQHLPQAPYSPGSESPVADPGGYGPGAYRPAGGPFPAGYPAAPTGPAGSHPQGQPGYPPAGGWSSPPTGAGGGGAAPTPAGAGGGWGQAPQPGPADWQNLATGPIPVVAPGGTTSAIATRRRRPRLPALIIAAVVVLALLVGGGIFFFAHQSAQSAGGKDTPQEAASALLTSFTQKDPVGLADQLDPSEASVFADMSGDVMTQLKRLGILDQSAGPTNTSGSSVQVENLTYGSTPVVVNDHLQLITITGGTITLTSDPAKLPLTDKLKNAVGSALADQKAQTRVYNVANQTKRLGHPLQIATVKRGDKWYPSLFYSVANLAAQEKHLGTPTSSIPAQGSSSPEAAMNTLLDAVSAGDLSKAIAITSPDEMSVLHDYGPLLLANYHAQPTPLKFSNAQWNVTDATGGKLVSLKSLTVSTGGQATTIERDVAGNSLTVTVPGHPAVVLSDSTIDQFLNSDTLANIGFWGGSETCTSSSSSSGSGPTESCSPEPGQAPQLDATTKDIVKREFHQVLALGVVMTQSGGAWYVSPLRSYSNVLVTLLKGLQPSDVDYFLAKIGK